MLPNMKETPNAGVFIRKTAVVAPQMPPKYTVEDWDYSNRRKLRITLDQQRLKEVLQEDTRRVIDEVTETTKDWQREVEHNLKERVDEIQFLCDELNKQKKTALLENEALTTYKNRLENAIDFLKDKSLSICKQCLLWREKRIGVDFCDDEVDRQLCRELKTIKGCQSLLDKTYKETVEQIRKLKAASFLLDEDLEFKYKSLLIDKQNIRLRDTQHDLGKGLDLTQHACIYPLVVWKTQTYKNLENNAKELNAASQLRTYIDLLLLQVCDDMRNQTESTNVAFGRSITQIKDIKRRLEEKHNDIMASVIDVEKQIKQLEHQMGTEERAMLLCRTRLSYRSRRPGLELTCDLVQESLQQEMEALQSSFCKLKQKIDQNKALLRYLLHTQLMQEEEINIKANTIKIDEVDCMTLRLALQYTNF